MAATSFLEQELDQMPPEESLLGLEAEEDADGRKSLDAYAPDDERANTAKAKVFAPLLQQQMD